MSDDRFENVDDHYDSTNSNNQQPVEKERYEEYAIIGFICSIIGLFIFRLILGIVGLVFSMKAKRKIEENPSLKGKELATAGFIISIVDIVLSVVGFLLILFYFATALYI